MKENKNKEVNQKTKKKRFPLLLLIVLAVVLIIAFIVLIVSLVVSSKEFVYEMDAKDIKDIKCLKAGEVCSAKDIYKGVKVKYAVNNKKTYEFYLVSNDEENATFVMADSLMKGNWSVEMINLKGPNAALTNLNEKVSDWDNVPAIESYTYQDYGYKYFLEHCNSSDEKEEKDDYNCTLGGGFKSLSITDGKANIIHNLPQSDSADMSEDEEEGLITDWDFDGATLRARLLTKEEVEAIRDPKKGFPKWLIDHTKKDDAYWLLSSDTYESDDYNVSAFQLVNHENEAELGVSYVIKTDSKDNPIVSIRPVITLKKQ